MKAITLLQPRATLVAIGALLTEVRPDTTTYRGRIAIHAAWHWPPFLRDLTEEEPVWSALRAQRYHHRNLPRGAVVAVGELVAVTPVHPGEACWATPLEGRVHDFSAGRYVWTFRSITRLRPIGAPGRPRLWDWPDPPWLEDRLKEPPEATGP